MKSYKLSVRLMTYNHGNYIEEALKGIDIQKTDFSFEVVVGDDFSTDDTLSKIRVYNFTNPNLDLRILEREVGDSYHKQRKKKGRLYNFVDILNNCTGEYIALLDGDDYWTDPLKLQKQVDFLEGNKDFGICFHRVSIFNQQENKFYEDNITREVPTVTDIKDLARGNYIHTPSVMLRNDINLPEWFLNCALGDWTLYVLQIKDRYIKKMDEIMAVYRIHEDGIWAKESQEYRSKLTRQNFDYVSFKADLDLSIKRILSPQLYNKSQTLSKPNYFLKLIKKIRKK